MRDLTPKESPWLIAATSAVLKSLTPSNRSAKLLIRDFI